MYNWDSRLATFCAKAWNMVRRQPPEGAASRPAPSPASPPENPARDVCERPLIWQACGDLCRLQVLVEGDNALVVNGCSGVWRVFDPTLRGPPREIHNCIYRMRHSHALRTAEKAGELFSWIPRELNGKADELATQDLGMRLHQAVHPADMSCLRLRARFDGSRGPGRTGVGWHVFWPSTEPIADGSWRLDPNLSAQACEFIACLSVLLFVEAWILRWPPERIHSHVDPTRLQRLTFLS